jgi:hypothetical protein
MVNEEALTASTLPFEEQALMLGEVVPVTETVAPTVRSVVRVVAAFGSVGTKMETVLPLGVKRNPSMEPSGA